MEYVLCHFCGDKYNKKRQDLGYRSCLECGQKHAQKEKNFKAKCTAPAYNKGAYQYVSTKAQVVGIFKCGGEK